MKIKIDFYREGGKWYSGGTVDIENVKLWEVEKFKQTIVNNQNCLTDGWQGNYFVVTQDLPEHDKNPEYTDFYYRLFHPHEFYGIRKQIDFNNIQFTETPTNIIQEAIEEYKKQEQEAIGRCEGSLQTLKLYD